MFAFSLPRPPPAFSRISKTTSGCVGHTGSQACRVPRVFGAENQGLFGHAFQSCVPAWSSPCPHTRGGLVCPFPYPRMLSLPDKSIGRLGHMDINTGACVLRQLETPKVGEGGVSSFDLGRRVGWWVIGPLFPLPSSGTKPSGLSSSCWVWGRCSRGIFS